jgi:tRNA (guanine-N7-)-methyltransferase
MVVARHAGAPFRKPYADYNRAAFALSFERYQRLAANAPLILDACCGVGESSVALARAFPAHYVIGVDQSATRLRRGQQRQQAQARVTRVTRGGGCLACQPRPGARRSGRLLASAARRRPAPRSPLPALSQPLAKNRPPAPALAWTPGFSGAAGSRRSARMPQQLADLHRRALSGGAATHWPSGICEPFVPDLPMTPFERKYLDSGHGLFRTVTHLT